MGILSLLRLGIGVALLRNIAVAAGNQENEYVIIFKPACCDVLPQVQLKVIK